MLADRYKDITVEAITKINKQIEIDNRPMKVEQIVSGILERAERSAEKGYYDVILKGPLFTSHMFSESERKLRNKVQCHKLFRNIINQWDRVHTEITSEGFNMTKSRIGSHVNHITISWGKN